VLQAKAEQRRLFKRRQVCAAFEFRRQSYFGCFCAKRKGGTSFGRPALVSNQRSDSAFLDAVKLVATATVLTEFRKRFLEAIEILYRRAGGLGVAAEFDEPGLEVCHVFPDFWRGRRLSTDLRIVGEQRGHFGCGIFKSGEGLLRGWQIKGRFALDHFCQAASRLPIRLHQRLPGSDRVLLARDCGRAQGKNYERREGG